MYFLANRFRNHKVMTESGKSVIQDRSIYEDAEIFARNLYEMGNMDQRDYSNYVALFHVMMDYLKPPDLMIYLRTSVETLVEQIARRGRSFEQGIEKSYLELLNKHYEDWIRRYSVGPVLVVESDRLDFVNKPDDLDEIVRLIEAKIPRTN